MKLTFNIHYNTKFGENLQIRIIEKGFADQLHPLTHTARGHWTAELDFYSKSISYCYQVMAHGLIIDEELVPHHLTFPHTIKEYRIFDFWNLKNFPENYLTNKILTHRLKNFKGRKLNILRKHTHHFRLEAPLFNDSWRIVICGAPDELGNWNYSEALPMIQTKPGIWELPVHMEGAHSIQYKYGILDIRSGDVELESGGNRLAVMNEEENVLYVIADHYFRYRSHQLYHAAGVAVPVFSLRSERGYGVGEFADLAELGDWAKATNLSVIQILPINDTTATHTWTDSYPYAAVSVYALHPQYISVEGLSYKLSGSMKEGYDNERKELNGLPVIDYQRVLDGKWRYLKELFSENKEQITKDRNFRKFIKENEKWLMPYAAFCILRDKNGTPNFNTWKTHRKFIPGKLQLSYSPKSRDHDLLLLHQWVQYELHRQLTDAVTHLHNLGISIKGDLPIGIYRYSVEAWTEPHLFDMDYQAGAPPDQFSELGQNWEFPTYNWEAMKADGYRWWKNRFKALENYFDAMRIDHILGFFRIWRIHSSAVQGILGYFHPAIPVTLQEFQSRNIAFRDARYCKPFINPEILQDVFGESCDEVKSNFMTEVEEDRFIFKPEFDTQRKLKEYFADRTDSVLLDKLFDLSANVLFLSEEKEGETVFHPRFNLHKTSSFKYLSEKEKTAVYDLYLDYFYRRQDHLWYSSAVEKLPEILNSTEMLICGEDLGLVPKCVPAVMDKLGITALKVQRMPSEDIPFYNPKNAGYMNVVTSSSHDSSTLRQWWQEDRTMTEKYFREQLTQWGTPPSELVPPLAEIIMKQHFYSDAMLAIFPIQEFLATDNDLRNPEQEVERINNPAVFPHYWNYRMHLEINKLLQAEKFNKKISHWVTDSNRL